MTTENICTGSVQLPQFRSLLEIIRALQSDLGPNSLIFTVTQRTPRIVGADRCTLYFVDNGGQGLYAMQGEVNIKIPMGKGIAGTVATSKEIINIPNAYEVQCERGAKLCPGV